MKKKKKTLASVMHEISKQNKKKRLRLTVKLDKTLNGQTRTI